MGIDARDKGGYARELTGAKKAEVGRILTEHIQAADLIITTAAIPGVTVRFAVHPVTGRMPGQMDVLLAEAGVPYDLIFQLEDINADFPDTDVVLVIGANDVVNPAARSDKSSPIYGMPILDVDRARHVYVVKRGEGKGYAGIQNALFYADNCNMVYGDAQAVLVKMIEAVRGLG